MFLIEMFKYELDRKTYNDLPEFETCMIAVQRLAQLMSLCAILLNVTSSERSA